MTRFAWLGAPTWQARCGLLALASILTLNNSVKPLHMDDAAYYAFASHIASHPLDPYGFDIFWYQQPEPANGVLAPPVFLYWWAAGIQIFGDHPFLWKLWLFPFAWLLVVAVYALAARLAPRWEMFLAGMVVFSPAVFPALNLMLDVPALALSLTAVALFLSACDRDSWPSVALAGLIAGLAAQTKYNGALACLAILIYSTLSRKVRLGILAAGLATVVFASWEAFTWWKYGESHFLLNLRQKHTVNLSPFDQIGPLLAMLGGVAPMAGLLVLASIGSARVWGIGVGAVVFGYAAIAWSPHAGPGGSWSEWIFGALGFGVCVAGVLAVVRLRRLARGRKGGRVPDTLTWFLAAWLIVELAGALFLSPFPAARRMIGPAVVFMFLAGRLAMATGLESVAWRRAAWTGILGAVFACLYEAVDYREASSVARAVDDTAALRATQSETRGSTVWYAGHWGLAYYAEQRGWKAVVPASSAGSEGGSQLHAGDWLIIPDPHFYQQHVDLSGPFKLLTVIREDDWLPYRTVPCYYMGSTPLENKTGPLRLVLAVYRVTADTTARAPTPAH